MHQPNGPLDYPSSSGYQSDSGRTARSNPHKYLLYKPTFSQLYTYIASGFRELPPNGVLLVYLSGDPWSPPSGSSGSLEQSETDRSKKFPLDSCWQYGGLVTASLNSMCDPLSSTDDMPMRVLSDPNQNQNCFYPGDLIPFTRKPMVLVINSPNSAVFRYLVQQRSSPGHNQPHQHQVHHQNLPSSRQQMSSVSFASLFGQPILCLLSPEQTVPPSVPGRSNENPAQSQSGSLFTLFLHSPLSALCFLCGKVRIPVSVWQRAEGLLESIFTQISYHCIVGMKSTLYTLKTGIRPEGPHVVLDVNFARFFADDFLRLLITRFIFCSVVMRLHRAFKNRQVFHPSCYPPLSEGLLREIINSTAASGHSVHSLLLQLAGLLDCRSLFIDPPGTREQQQQQPQQQHHQESQQHLQHQQQHLQESQQHLQHQQQQQQQQDFDYFTTTSSSVSDSDRGLDDGGRIGAQPATTRTGREIRQQQQQQRNGEYPEQRRGGRASSEERWRSDQQQHQQKQQKHQQQQQQQSDFQDSDTYYRGANEDLVDSGAGRRRDQKYQDQHRHYQDQHHPYQDQQYPQQRQEHRQQQHQQQPQYHHQPMDERLRRTEYQDGKQSVQQRKAEHVDSRSSRDPKQQRAELFAYDGEYDIAGSKSHDQMRQTGDYHTAGDYSNQPQRKSDKTPRLPEQNRIDSFGVANEFEVNTQKQRDRAMLSRGEQMPSAVYGAPSRGMGRGY